MQCLHLIFGAHNAAMQKDLLLRKRTFLMTTGDVRPCGTRQCTSSRDLVKCSFLRLSAGAILPLVLMAVEVDFEASN